MLIRSDANGTRGRYETVIGLSLLATGSVHALHGKMGNVW